MTQRPLRRVIPWVFGAFVVAVVLVRLGLSGPAAGASPQGPAPQANAADFGVWTSIGPSHLTPNNWAGRVAAVAVDPANPSHWLAGTALGGVWETPDAGATWQPRSDGQPSLAIGAIAFAPSSPNVVYAGTGEANFSVWVYAGAGMLRSDDGGATWYLVNAPSFAKAAVRAIIVNPADANNVLAGTARGVAGRDLGRVWSPPIFGVHRSSDGGRTWARVLTGQVSSLVSHPATFTRQYAVIGEPAAIPNATPPADVQPGTMPNGLYRSMDGGATWTPIPGPWTSTNPAVYGSGYIDLAIAPSNPEVMYASVQTGGGGGNAGLRGLFRTNNAWAQTPEWIEIPLAGVTSQAGATTVPGYCTSCAYMNVITVDPSDADTVFAAGNDIWRCRSCSTNPAWAKVTVNGKPTSLVHGDHHALVWAGNRLISANDGGVYSSVDRGENWQPHNAGLANLQIYSGAVHPTRDDVLGNTQDSLLIRGNAWGPWTNIANSRTFAEGQVAMSSTRPDTDWMVNYLYSRVGRTRDGGRTFQPVEAGIDYRAPYTNLPFQPTLRKCPDNDDVVFLGANRLWRTNEFFTAASPTWSVNAPDFDVSSCTAPGRPPATCAVIHALAFTGSDNGTCNAYAYGTGGGFMRITANGGASWSDFDPSDGIPNRAVTAIAFVKSNPNIAYVTLSGFDEDAPRAPARPGHVFRTANAMSGSPVWINVSPPSNVPFNTIAIDPRTPDTVYVGSDSGVWASRDGGTSWAYMGPGSGLPNTAVFDLQIQASTGKVFAFTFGRGAYVLTPAVSAAASSER